MTPPSTPPGSSGSSPKPPAAKPAAKPAPEAKPPAAPSAASAPKPSSGTFNPANPGRAPPPGRGSQGTVVPPKPLSNAATATAPGRPASVPTAATASAPAAAPASAPPAAKAPPSIKAAPRATAPAPAMPAAPPPAQSAVPGVFVDHGPTTESAPLVMETAAPPVAKAEPAPAAVPSPVVSTPIAAAAPSAADPPAPAAEVKRDAAAAAPAAPHAPLAKSHRWHEHVPRTTAALAVLAAVSSGQYSGQFSKTILSQAEVTDVWSYYQSKSIKRHLTQNQADLAHELGVGKPEMAAQLADFEQKNLDLAKKYDGELAKIKAQAATIENEKAKHQRQGDRFQLAFVILQAGVVLSTVAASAKRRELWIFAIICGVLGLLMVADAYLLLDLKLFAPATQVVQAGGG